MERRRARPCRISRETGAMEMKEMKEKVDIEIEAFIHGAMCIAYSGRCTLSNHMTARDSNRGGCCQSCRWDYDLLQVDDDGELDLYYEDGDVIPFAMSPKDLKLIESIPQMMELGIDSLKSKVERNLSIILQQSFQCIVKL